MVEHTTVGRRLTALERSFGSPVVLRGPEGLRLTPLGDRLIPLVEEVERAVSAARDLAASQRGRVRLAVPSGVTRLFTAGLAKLCMDHPGLSLEIVNGSRPVDLKKGEADLAIRSGPVVDKELVARKLCESGLSLYAAEAYLARRSVPSDLVAAPCGGVGLAVLPCMFGDFEPTLRRHTPHVLASRTLSLSYRREVKLSKHVRAVIGFVVDVMRANADQISGERIDQRRMRAAT